MKAVCFAKEDPWAEGAGRGLREAPPTPRAASPAETQGRASWS